jgi:hypothetical protein
VVCLPVSSFHNWWNEEGTPEFPNEHEYDWVVGRRPPNTIIPHSSRLYIVCGGLLRGFAPILRVDPWDAKHWALVRDGRSAEAVTVDAPIRSFRGWRYRWWDRREEGPFTDWAWEAVPPRP